MVAAVTPPTIWLDRGESSFAAGNASRLSARDLYSRRRFSRPAFVLRAKYLRSRSRTRRIAPRHASLQYEAVVRRESRGGS